MNNKKKIIELIAILKNIFRFAMFNHKGSICIIELSQFVNQLKNFVNENEVLFSQTNKYSLFKNSAQITINLFTEKKYYELAIEANNTYHSLCEIIGAPLKEYDFQIVSSDLTYEKKDVLKNETIIILDNIRSPFNVGSFFRTADAAGLKEIYLIGMTPTPENPKVKRAAMQADIYVNWQYFQFAETAIKKIKDENYKIISVETTNTSIDYYKIDYSFFKKTAFVFGNEEFGINENVISVSDKIIKIPMFGRKNSLNVGISAGIILFDYLKSFVCNNNPHKY